MTIKYWINKNVLVHNFFKIMIVLQFLLFGVNCLFFVPTKIKILPDKIAEYQTDCKKGCDYLKTLQDSGECSISEFKSGVISCENYCINEEKIGHKMNASCWTGISQCSDLKNICNLNVYNDAGSDK